MKKNYSWYSKIYISDELKQDNTNKKVILKVYDVSSNVSNKLSYQREKNALLKLKSESINFLVQKF